MTQPHRAEIQEDIIKKLEGMIKDGTLCGFSVGFVAKEEARTVYGGVMGAVSPYDCRPVEAGLYYDLASLSKVTGTTSRIMQLWQSGELSMDTPVRKLLPSFRWEGITVGHLLLHNSGLPAEIRDKKSLTRENILVRLYETEPESAPGERFTYSDVGYILLGLIIREGTGLREHESLGESFRRHVFQPLGMENTSFPKLKHPSLCLPTEMTEKRGLICGQIHDSKAWLLGESGSAGLFSTLDDLVLFVQAYLKESETLFSRETYHLIRATDRLGRTYGWSREYGGETLYHTGFTGTSILMDFRKEEGMILLTNRIHPDRGNTVFLEERNRINQMWLEQND